RRERSPAAASARSAPGNARREKRGRRGSASGSQRLAPPPPGGPPRDREGRRLPRGAMSEAAARIEPSPQPFEPRTRVGTGVLPDPFESGVRVPRERSCCCLGQELTAAVEPEI